MATATVWIVFYKTIDIRLHKKMVVLQARHVLRVMPDFELTPNDISFNAALHACYKGQNMLHSPT